MPVRLLPVLVPAELFLIAICIFEVDSPRTALHKPQETMCSPAAWVLVGATLAGLLLGFKPAPADGAHALLIRVWSQIERESKSAGFELVTLSQTVYYSSSIDLITFSNYTLIKANVSICS